MIELERHPTRRLGRRPPTNKPALRLAPLLTGVIPAAPPSADHFSAIAHWILGGNDRYGDCGPVSVANQRLLVTSYLAGAPHVVTQDEIFDLYRRSGNPNFDPATGAGDDGVDMQTMLEALIADGIGGTKALAFAKVNVTNEQEWQAAIAIFGSLLFGVTLETAQSTGTLWDYHISRIWGGHAIVCGRYRENDAPGTDEPDRTGVVSWAEVIDMTDAFIDHQLDEAWVVIWPETLGTTQFQQGIDLATLAADYTALTDRPFPVQPGPEPSPATDAADATLAAAVRLWAFARHSGANRRAALAVQAWLKAKGL
jgi:hypothetical protein